MNAGITALYIVEKLSKPAQTPEEFKEQLSLIFLQVDNTWKFYILSPEYSSYLFRAYVTFYLTLVRKLIFDLNGFQQNHFERLLYTMKKHIVEIEDELEHFNYLRPPRNEKREKLNNIHLNVGKLEILVNKLLKCLEENDLTPKEGE